MVDLILKIYLYNYTNFILNSINIIQMFSLDFTVIIIMKMLLVKLLLQFIMDAL